MDSGDQDLIAHCLHKISLQTVVHFQTPHFDLDKHGASFANVICSLCSASAVLRALVRAQFYRACPLAVPLLLRDEECSVDQYRMWMGYKRTGSTGASSSSQVSTYIHPCIYIACIYVVLALRDAFLC